MEPLLLPHAFPIFGLQLGILLLLNLCRLLPCWWCYDEPIAVPEYSVVNTLRCSFAQPVASVFMSFYPMPS